MKKTESTVVYGEKESKNDQKGEFNVFSGKAIRLDGKNPEKALTKPPVQDIPAEYDPRKHRLPNGVVDLTFNIFLL